MKSVQKYRLLTILSFVLAVVLTGGGFWYWQRTDDNSSNQENQIEIATTNQDEKSNALPSLTITRVIDGDTIEAGQERIRLIGINAEEINQPDSGKTTSCRALAAKEYLTSLLLDKTVEIEIGQEPKDQYNRTLAYVFLDQGLVNALLVEEGLADVWLIAPNTKYHQQLIEAQVVGLEKQANIDFCQTLN
jgi:micrococcal nuclease